MKVAFKNVFLMYKNFRPKYEACFFNCYPILEGKKEKKKSQHLFILANSIKSEESTESLWAHQVRKSIWKYSDLWARGIDLPVLCSQHYPIHGNACEKRRPDRQGSGVSKISNVITNFIFSSGYFDQDVC